MGPRRESATNSAIDSEASILAYSLHFAFLSTCASAWFDHLQVDSPKVTPINSPVLYDSQTLSECQGPSGIRLHYRKIESQSDFAILFYRKRFCDISKHRKRFCDILKHRKRFCDVLKYRKISFAINGTRKI